MDANFWHQKWERGDIGFHQSQVNDFLQAHFRQLHVPAGARVFLPLCGKTLDFAWLLGQGYRVAGVELNEGAIRDLFQSLALAPTIVNDGELLRYSAPDIDIFVGDVFALSPQQLGTVDAVYDRAALVALPANTRQRYASHLIQLTHAAPQLLISYEYDPSLIDGPPFSVTENEIHQRYGGAFTLQILERREVEGGMKGKVPASEACWRLSRMNISQT